MAHSLAGRTALITGSTSGIGYAIAEEYLQRGANVMFTGLFMGPTANEDRSAFLAKLETLKAAFPNQKLGFEEANVTDPEAVQKLVDETARLDGHDKIDILINNAGVQRQQDIEHQPIGHWDLVIDTNLNGVVYCSKLALPYLKKSDDAHVINMSSVHGLVVSPERSAYCAAKHAVEAFTDTLNAEESGIKAHSICPAFVKTPLALGPINAYAKGLQTTFPELAGRDDIAYELAEHWRLHAQDNRWIELSEVAAAAANLADGTSSDRRIVLDNGYVDRARANNGVAVFPDITQTQVTEALENAKTVDAGSAECSATQGKGAARSA